MAASRAGAQSGRPVEEQTVGELRQAWARGLRSIRARNRVARQAIYSLQDQIAAVEAADPALVAALEAERKLAPGRDEAWQQARAALRAARAANATRAALIQQRTVLLRGMVRDDTIPDERDAKLAANELRRRGRRP